jgi:predicted metal-dependent phosphoesterase TrpH
VTDLRRIDLHSHTEHSDGTHTPTGLVTAAAAIGLAALAVTDHDTTSALDEAHVEGTRVGVEVIDGCEISSRIDRTTVHMLAYGFRREDVDLQEFLAEVRRGREERNDLLFQRLADLGVPVERHEVSAHVRGRIVARPHFARALVDRGYVPDVRTAFQKYLADFGPAYVSPVAPAPEEAIKAAVAAGGAPVLAHPKQLRLGSTEEYARLIRRLRDVGLAGVEADHPSHDAGERKTFRALAHDLGLVATGGSDFHGLNKPHIAIGTGDGSICVPYETWEALAARRR